MYLGIISVVLKIRLIDHGLQDNLSYVDNFTVFRLACMITGHISDIESTNIYQVCILEPCQLLMNMGL